jgi:hypothetical protein
MRGNYSIGGGAKGSREILVESIYSVWLPMVDEERGEVCK